MDVVFGMRRRTRPPADKTESFAMLYKCVLILKSLQAIFGSGLLCLFRWGEHPREPAREQSRPTKVAQYQQFSGLFLLLI